MSPQLCRETSSTSCVLTLMPSRFAFPHAVEPEDDEDEDDDDDDDEDDEDDDDDDMDEDDVSIPGDSVEAHVH